MHTQQPGATSPGSNAERAPLDVILTIQHPAHVHFFKYAIEELEGAGHAVHVFVRENEVAVDLLETYEIEHTILVRESTSLTSLAFTQVKYEYRLWRHARRIEPDVMAAVGGVTVSHVAKLVGARAVAFSDTEHATIVNTLAFPFADTVCTPRCFYDEIGRKQISYPGYHELAYLHPDRFTPSPSILEEVGLSADDTVVVLRVSAWESSHDFVQSGFSDVGHVIETLEATGADVVVTSEIDLPPEFEDRRIDVPPHRMHDLLSTADLYVGEGATMAAESAVLGTPAVYVNSLEMGYIEELEERYGLLHRFTGAERHDRALATAERLLTEHMNGRWAEKRRRLLGETVDVTEVIVDVIEGSSHPDQGRRSSVTIKEQPVQPAD